MRESRCFWRVKQKRLQSKIMIGAQERERHAFFIMDSTAPFVDSHSESDMAKSAVITLRFITLNPYQRRVALTWLIPYKT